MAKVNGVLQLVYDGLSSPLDFERNFNIHALYNEWSNARQLAILPSLLKEKADRVYKALNKNGADGTAKTAAVLLKELVAGCQEQKETLLYQFYGRTRRVDESISRFAVELQLLLEKAMPGLDPEYMASLLRAQLCLHVPESLRALIQFSSTFGVNSWDNLLACLDKTCPQSIIKSPDAAGKWEAFSSNLIKSENIKEEPLDAQWADSRRASTSRYQGKRFEGTCDFCKFYGHKISDCRKRMRLQKQSTNRGVQQASYGSRPTSDYSSNYERRQNTQDKGHPKESNVFSSETNFRASLNENSMDNEMCENIDENDPNNEEYPFFLDAENFSIDILHVDFNDGKISMRVKVKIKLFGMNEMEVLALADSGSSHSFISPKILSKEQENAIRSPTNNHGFRKNLTINGATGSSKAGCFVTNQFLKIGNWKGEMQFVMAGSICTHAMVLGRDFFKRYGVKMDFESDKMIIGKEKIEIFQALVTDSKDKLRNKRIEDELLAVKLVLEETQEKLKSFGLEIKPTNENSADLLNIDFSKPIIETTHISESTSTEELD